MALQSNFLTYRNSSIHYCRYGNGPNLLFCFHGYGENAESFAFLEEKLAADYTLIAIDMPFHGQTEWREGLAFSSEELVGIIKQIQQAGEQISLLGYSMGGRIALQLLQQIPALIQRIVLIAPDGLHKNYWYWFSTQTYLGNKIFRRAMHNPKRLFRFLRFAEKYRLVHKSIAKVAHYYLDDAAERISLYQRWTSFRDFRPDLSLVKKMVAKYNMPVRLLFGKYDNIILSKHADVFKDDTKNVKVYVIEAGHRLLQQKHVDVIAGMFYQ